MPPEHDLASPPSSPTPSPSAPKQLIYAHRGASLELPENTIEAFRLAVGFGIRAIETDAHMTRDGHVVLSHDPTGGRMAGVPRAIRDCTLEEVRAWDMGTNFQKALGKRFVIPTLAEALAEFPEVFFNVDAKQTSPNMVSALVDCIRRCGAESRVRIASFSNKNLRRARALRYEGETGLSPVELAKIFFLPIAAVRWLGVAGKRAQVPVEARGVRFASKEAIDRLHSLGVGVDFWTINDGEIARGLFALGADGVMTDDPRAMCEALPTLAAPSR